MTKLKNLELENYFATTGLMISLILVGLFLAYKSTINLLIATLCSILFVIYSDRLNYLIKQKIKNKYLYGEQ